jgi:signal transduction histidine kinase
VPPATGLEQQSTTKIFDAYVTTKDKGTGLGLALSRMIVELYGGRIIAQSDPGSGVVTNKSSDTVISAMSRAWRIA